MNEPQRRLSPWRVMLGIAIVIGLMASSVAGARQWQATRSLSSDEPWFASYVDVTATPTYAFEQQGATSHGDTVLSFVVAAPEDGCTPTWGGAYSLDEAAETLDLERRIERLRQQGGSVAISFGGLRNSELAVSCKNDAELLQAYKTVIDRYKIDTIDLDLEKEGLVDSDAAARRARVISQLQQQRRQQDKNLAVWVTLPVTPQGLSEDGIKAVSTLLSQKVDLAGVNIMTMDYGPSRSDSQSMQRAAESALQETHRQLGVLYKRAGIPLNSATIWAKLGATPMIGQNDIADEVFTTADARGLNSFGRQHGLGRMSMWSANRDIACSGNYVNLKVVSDACSGVSQSKFQFAQSLSKGFNGNLTGNSGKATTADKAAATVKTDNPATSPYPIWSESGAYLKGTKVVWKQNVYEAKWWTKGDQPDSPVLQSWEISWKLVGPVLPGEKPVKQATLPAGTYPEWAGTTAYNTGDRILFEGVPYQAKWWNQGDSPAAASSNADGSPWVPLTQAQINDILAAQKDKR